MDSTIVEFVTIWCLENIIWIEFESSRSFDQSHIKKIPNIMYWVHITIIHAILSIQTVDILKIYTFIFNRFCVNF